MKRTIVLGLTGSVASVLYLKLVKKLQTLGDVVVILTEKAEHFVADDFDGVKVFRESKEWVWFRDGKLTNKWQKDDPVLHIKLRDMGSALVIAPCSANTLGKLANGLCDNLLTSVARAWDSQRPVVLAPAMNTHMWEHPVTDKNIERVREWGYHIVDPQSKMLACGTEGMGAMADIDWIVARTKEQLQWTLPVDLRYFSGVPVGNHPGAFACQRKHEKHTGLDLYCDDGTRVHAVEAGRIINIEHFTGEWDNSPWWNNTDCILVEGATGVVCYGEVEVPHWLHRGLRVEKGQYIANVKRVLKDGKERKDIPGHNTSMLHMELYPHGVLKASNGFEAHLQDPTPFLFDSIDGYRLKKLIYEKSQESQA